MKKTVRSLFTFGGILSTYFFIYFPLMFLAPSLETDTHRITALVVALLLGAFLWLITRNVFEEFGRKVLLTAVIVGTIGFLPGFIGPIVFSPDSPQGPMLGIFITGPLSFVIGLIGGSIYWKTKLNKREIE